MSSPGFIESLFDYSFKRFVVVRIVRWFYRVTIFAAGFLLVGLICLGVVSMVSAQSDIDALAATGGDIALLTAATTRRTLSMIPIVLSIPLSAAMVLAGRVLSEVTIVLFKIAEALTSQSEEQPPSPQTPPDP